MKLLEKLFKKNKDTYNPVVWGGDVDYLKLANQVKKELDEKENKRKEHYMDFLKNIVDKVEESNEDDWLDYMIDLNQNILYIKNTYTKKTLRIERVSKPLANATIYDSTVIVHVTDISDPMHTVLLEIYVPAANVSDTFDCITFFIN